jgi:hypothetical protein
VVSAEETPQQRKVFETIPVDTRFVPNDGSTLRTGSLGADAKKNALCRCPNCAFATDRSTTRFSLQLWSRLKGAGHLKFSFDTAINSFDEIGPALQVKGLE